MEEKGFIQRRYMLYSDSLSNFQLLQKLAIKMPLCHLGKQQFAHKRVERVFGFGFDVSVRITVDTLTSGSVFIWKRKILHCSIAATSTLPKLVSHDNDDIVNGKFL